MLFRSQERERFPYEYPTHLQSQIEALPRARILAAGKLLK